MKKPKITWRGMLLFLFIFYIYDVILFYCSYGMAFSFAMCTVFFVSVRPLILGETRRLFKHEAQRETIHDSSDGGEQVYAEPDDDDLP